MKKQLSITLLLSKLVVRTMVAFGFASTALMDHPKLLAICAILAVVATIALTKPTDYYVETNEEP